MNFHPFPSPRLPPGLILCPYTPTIPPTLMLLLKVHPSIHTPDSISFDLIKDMAFPIFSSLSCIFSFPLPTASFPSTYKSCYSFSQYYYNNQNILSILFHFFSLQQNALKELSKLTVSKFSPPILSQSHPCEAFAKTTFLKVINNPHMAVSNGQSSVLILLHLLLALNTVDDL